MDYRTFVTNLSNLERYKRDLQAVNGNLDTLLYILANVRGISYDQQGGSTNPSLKAQKWLDLDERYNLKLAEKEFIENAIKVIEDTLKQMPEELQNALVEVYCNGKTFREVCVEVGYTESGYWRYLKKETEKYL